MNNETLRIEISDASLTVEIIKGIDFCIVIKSIAEYFQISEEDLAVQLNSLGIDSSSKLIELPLFNRLVLNLTIRGNSRAVQHLLDCYNFSLSERIVDQIKDNITKKNRLRVKEFGLLSDDFWVNTVDAYLSTRLVSERYKSFVYTSIAEAVSMALFDLSPTELTDLDITRDTLDDDKLALINLIEYEVRIALDAGEIFILEVVNEALELLGFNADG